MKNLNEIIQLQAEVPLDWAGLRLDQALVRLFPEHSRSRLQHWISEGFVRIDDLQKRSRDKVQGGETVCIHAIQSTQTEWLPEENIALTIVYEDEEILVLNKPAGLIVHPGAGNNSNTLVNALLHHYPDLKQIPRAGIVHRLDKDTTGLMVIAKTLPAHTHLVAQLQSRKVQRIYEAIVWGVLTGGGSLHTQMGRHPKDRNKMAVVLEGQGKEAITHYRVIKRYEHHTHLEVSLETGRTHQIRVHLSHLRYPIVGDKMYGGRSRVPPKSSREKLAALQEFQRQALHAKRLTILHPKENKEMSWEIPHPKDMKDLLAIL